MAAQRDDVLIETGRTAVSEREGRCAAGQVPPQRCARPGTARAAAVLTAVLLVVAGCASPGSQANNASAVADADQAAVATITWDGGATDPKLGLKTPLRVSQPTAKVVEPGTGASIAMGQMVTFDSLVVDGETGAVEASTYRGSKPNTLILARSTADPTMIAALRSAKVGGRFLYAVPSPSTADSSTADPTATSAPPASKVLAISVRSVADVPPEAAGTAVAPDPALPKLAFTADRTPSIVPPKGKPSGALSSEVLIDGAGPRLTDGQTVAVKYYGWLWSGTAFDGVWGDTAPEVIDLNGVISGWRKALVGKKVGSRVLMVVPPALGYGGAGQASIPPDSTLIFVVDVLAAY